MSRRPYFRRYVETDICHSFDCECPRCEDKRDAEAPPEIEASEDRRPLDAYPGYEKPRD